MKMKAAVSPPGPLGYAGPRLSARREVGIVDDGLRTVEAQCGPPIELPTTAGLVVADLEAEGIDIAFGVPGGPIMAMFDALARRSRARVVPCKHEQGAVFAAYGHALSSGRLALAVVTSGPGTTHALPALATAYHDRVARIHPAAAFVTVVLNSGGNGMVEAGVRAQFRAEQPGARIGTLIHFASCDGAGEQAVSSVASARGSNSGALHRISRSSRRALRELMRFRGASRRHGPWHPCNRPSRRPVPTADRRSPRADEVLPNLAKIAGPKRLLKMLRLNRASISWPGAISTVCACYASAPNLGGGL